MLLDIFVEMRYILSAFFVKQIFTVTFDPLNTPRIYLWMVVSFMHLIFMHLADAFIQSDLQCIQVIHLLSVCVFPGNWNHDLCTANAMLYH